MTIALALLSIILVALAFAAKWGMDTLKNKPGMPLLWFGSLPDSPMTSTNAPAFLILTL